MTISRKPNNAMLGVYNKCRICGRDWFSHYEEAISAEEFNIKFVIVPTCENCEREAKKNMR